MIPAECEIGSYYGTIWIPLSPDNISWPDDPYNPDGAAQAFSSWTYVSLMLGLVFACSIANFSRQLQRVLISTGSNLLMISILLFVALGYGATPSLSVFWTSSFIVGLVAGTIFLVYGNAFFFMDIPTQTLGSKEVGGVCQHDGDKSETDAESVICHSTCDSQECSASHADEVVLDGFLEPNSEILPLGALHPNIQFVIGFLTFAIVTLEVSFVIALATDMPCETCAVEMTSSVVLIIQKIVQSVIYGCLSRKMANPSRLTQSILFLDIFGVLNFAFWMDSLSYAQHSLALKAAHKYYGEPFKILEVLYEALVADFRLLCCALFVEHAQDIRTEFRSGLRITDEEYGPETDHEVTVPVIIYSLREQHYRYLGYGVGFSFVAIEILKNLKHVHKLHLPPGFSLLGLVVYATLGVCVVLFIRSNTSRRGNSEGHSLVGFLVAGMGAAGLFYFCFRIALNVHFIGKFNSEIQEDAIWDTVNCAGKCISLVFLLYLFLNINEEAVAENFHKKTTQFLLPMLTVTIFGIFLGTLVEFHQSKLTKTVICHSRITSLTMLFTAAPPLYLGFLMHSFAKVYITSKHARKRNLKLRRRSGDRSLLEEHLIPPT